MISGAQKAKFSGVQILLAILLVAALVFVGYNVWVIVDDTGRDSDNLEVVAGLRVLSPSLTSELREATAGNDAAFTNLEATVNKMNSSWQTLKGSLEQEEGLDTSALSNMDNSWAIVKENADGILGNKDNILYLNSVAAQLNEALPELQQAHIDVVDILVDGQAPGGQVAKAQEQAWLAERVGRNIDRMLAGGTDAEGAADQFNQDARLFGVVLEGMRKGDTAMGISRVRNRAASKNLEQISKQFEFVSSGVDSIYQATPALFQARKASNIILDESPRLVNEITELTGVINGLSEKRVFNEQTALIGAVAALVIVFLMIVLSLVRTRKRSRETAEANERNQQALLQLLDEISGLAEGDLTTEATVSEDFTGHIADAFNYAIDQLRVLVSRVVDTAENVSASANETRATALQLSEASEHQAQEIIGASAAINEMAVTIDQVSTNASESAVVAERSVSIAKKGGEVVRDTISGMDTIREQIQDTSKRIKRLGESSQEIGDIVSLINEIADQTNILALNAAIQASMAGEAGRGFAVVADEVQGLAERSAAATKQIASLVKTIQTDTNEAVSSMEQTTTEVVKGADFAHNAGVALEEIENVSADLAELIQDISSAARQQSKTASHVSGTMNVIQEISSQTLSGTTTTASSVGELAEMAVAMRESVSDFKLPDTTVAEPAPVVTDSLDELSGTEVGDFQPFDEDQQPLEDGIEEQPEADELVAMAEDIADTLSDNDDLVIAADSEFLPSEDISIDKDTNMDDIADHQEEVVIELDDDLVDSDDNDRRF